MAAGIPIRSTGKVDTIWPFSGDGGANASYGRALQQPGLIAPMSPTAGGLLEVVLSSNVAYYGRFVPSSTRLLNKIAFFLNVVGTVDVACDVGIYDAAGNRLVSAGATSGKLNTAQGWQEINVTDTPLTLGTPHYAAFSVGTITGTVPRLIMRNWLVAAMAESFGTTIGTVEAFYGTASHPLPTTATKTGPVASVPILALRD